MKNKLISAVLTIAVFIVCTAIQIPFISAAEPDFENDYTLFDWEPIGNAYWMSTEPNLYNQLITKENKPSASNLGMFVSSKRMFTKEDIPVGSYIQIDKGYQYRPEQWTEGMGVQSVRPENVTETLVYVDEAWWGESVYKAFNISSLSSAQIGNKVNEIRSIFRIYIPKGVEPSIEPTKSPSPESSTSPAPSPSLQPTSTPTVPPVEEPDDTLKILAIGNSFSQDAMEYLYNIAKAGGVDKLVLGNFFIGGGTLKQHWDNSQKGVKCTYEKRDNTNTAVNYSRTLESCIKDENWDIITLQQASGSSGMPDTYEPYLTNLIDFVENNATNPDVKIGWHMTWAYQQNTTHNEFSKYDKDQMTMYNAIVNTVNDKVIPTEKFDFIIPSGTAIQNMRTSYIGDNLTRDTYHMSYVLGRYTVGLTWFKTLTGLPIEDIIWAPSPQGNDKITAAALKTIKEAVNNAVLSPYEVSKSTYTDEYPYIISAPVIGNNAVKTEFTKIRETEGADYFIAAVYDQNGVLVKVKIEKKTAQITSDTLVTFEEDFGDECVVKAFVFDDLETIMPLGKMF